MASLKNNLLHLSLREAFLNIVPYYVLSSLGLVLVDVFGIKADTSNIFILSLLSIPNFFSNFIILSSFNKL